MVHVNVDTDRHRGSRRMLLWGHCRVGKSVRRDHRPTDVHDLLAMTRHAQHVCEVEHTSTRRRPDPTSSQGSHMPHHHKKVKFSHTCYRPLGPELIPVYRQSARRWREVNHAIGLAVGCYYFLPGLWKSIRPVKIEWWGVGVVICLERGTDCLHMVQLMPLHPIISCLI